VSATTDYRFRWQPQDPYGANAGPLRTSDVLRVSVKR
jgi:hypothetical protein